MESMGAYVWPGRVAIFIRLILVVCLWAFGTVNEHQLLLSLTPWENYGVPPEKAQRIIGADLIYGLDHKLKARVYVETSNGTEYRCCGWPGPDGWVKLSEPLSSYYEYVSVDDKRCAEWIQEQWRLNDSSRNSVDIVNLGSCRGSNAYVSYYIGHDGIVWGRMLNEFSTSYDRAMLLIRFLKGLSFFIIFLLFLTLFKKEGYSNRNYEAQ